MFLVSRKYVHRLIWSAVLLLVLSPPTEVLSQTNAAPATRTVPAVATQSQIKFDVISFKRCERIDLSGKTTIIPPGGDSISRHCQVTAALFDFAYGGGGSPYLLKGEPAWMDTDAYDFLAKVAPEDVPEWQAMTMASRRQMLRDVFADVLNLKVHVETVARPVYNLVVAKGGPKLTESKPDPNAPAASLGNMGTMRYEGPDEAVYTGATMKLLANTLGARLDRSVIDMTGLRGTYDFRVKPLPFAHYNPKSSSAESMDFAAIIDGIQDLGLKLDPGKADASAFVIDHIDRPREN
ncbi:MAG TPA: TIGR03435 family protein [Acidobacteriaceae bacterium]|jgi:uncharacterized protein (TIGR03435 family)